ncbi:hypothetical protein, partial [Glaesserella sp.]|uniref:hypothetical protein n=2 Tax=Glaesserella sp. TaxID=2094731 RepID=UPI0035A164BB
SDGLPGKAGEDGKSITITGDRLDESGNRVLTFSDGKSITIPKGPKGDPGAPGGGGQSLYDLAINRSLFAGDVDEFIKQILLFPMGIKDMQVGKVVRSTLEVVEGTGNARVWRVPFVRAFSEPPAVLMIENSTVYHGGSFLVYKVTERDFLIRSNYPAGDGMSIYYLAFVPRN